MLLHRIGDASIGPVVGHIVLTKICGGYEAVGATKIDCKNYKRDVIQYIGHRDCQMVVDMLSKKKEMLPDYSFDYFISEDGKHGGAFWADDQAKRNYYAFGDVVSFDATYHSNKYDMVFIPFSGIDNHRKCVTFGGSLLRKEDVTSYTWLLECFAKAYPTEPKFILIDQDPSVMVAFEKVFRSARHRLCMWHIMEKVTTKVGVSICNKGFKAKLSQIVWTDKLEPDDFDMRWMNLVNEFGLVDNRWLTDMFNLRNYWIPTYFRNWAMSGLMRTSSRSESENHMFSQLTASTSTLVEFFSQFDTAMTAQRFEQSSYGFEKDVVSIFTKRVFLGMKKEIYHAIHSCMSLSIIQEDCWKKFVISDNSVSSTAIDDTIDRVANPRYFDELIPVESIVTYIGIEKDIFCSRKRYEHFGTFCRHIYYVMRMCKFDSFPKKYICPRWTRDIVPIQSYRFSFPAAPSIPQEPMLAELIRQIYYNVDMCVKRIIGHPEKMQSFLHSQITLFKRIDSEMGPSQMMGNKEFIAAMLGVSQTKEVNVLPPTDIRNKGSRHRKRIKSSREQSSSRAKNNKRKCAYCCKYVDHDIRNCPVRKVALATKGAQTSQISNLE